MKTAAGHKLFDSAFYRYDKQDLKSDQRIKIQKGPLGKAEKSSQIPSDQVNKDLSK